MCARRGPRGAGGDRTCGRAGGQLEASRHAHAHGGEDLPRPGCVRQRRARALSGLFRCLCRTYGTLPSVRCVRAGVGGGGDRAWWRQRADPRGGAGLRDILRHHRFRCDAQLAHLGPSRVRHHRGVVGGEQGDGPGRGAHGACLEPGGHIPPHGRRRAARGAIALEGVRRSEFGPQCGVHGDARGKGHDRTGRRVRGRVWIFQGDGGRVRNACARCARRGVSHFEVAYETVPRRLSLPHGRGGSAAYPRSAARRK